MSTEPKFIILDRDGVINQDSKEFIKTVDEFIPYPRSLQAIALLNQAGYKIVVATNQSGIARGFLSLQTLNDIHQKLIDELKTVGGKLEGIFFCPHGPDDQCECRKPKPGLLYQIKEQFKLDLRCTPVVGDSLRDLQSAKIAGCPPVLVMTGNGEKTLVQVRTEMELPVYQDLYEFAYSLIQTNGKAAYATSKT